MPRPNLAQEFWANAKPNTMLMNMASMQQQKICGEALQKNVAAFKILARLPPSAPASLPHNENATEVLKALLSTKTSKDVSDLPNRNKFILGVTSLWMIMPIAHGMVQWFQDGIGVGQKAVIAALSCSCLSSTMFWFDARRGSVFHKLDKLSAVQYVVCMVFVTALPGKSGRALSTGVGTFLPLSMISLFLLGDMCFK